MRRILLLVVVAVMAAGSFPARAAVTRTNDIVQVFNFYGGDVSGNNYYLYAYRPRSADSTSTNLNWQVAGQWNKYDANTNMYQIRNFPLQQVSGSTLMFDPAGNAGSLQGVLLADNPANTAWAFDITFTRPKNIGTCPCAIPDAWVDPYSAAVGASVTTNPGITRNGYTMAGTFAGNAMPVPATGMDFFLNSINVTVDATAP